MADYEFPLQAIQTGANLAQQGFNRSLQRRQLAGQEADRELRARVALQELELGAEKMKQETMIRMEKAKKEAQFQVGLQSFQDAVANDMDEGDAAMKFIAPFAGPEAALRMADSVADRREKARLAVESDDFMPGFGSTINPVTGEPEAFFKTSKNSAQLVRPDRASRPAALQEADEITRLQNEIDAATDPAVKSGLQRQLSNVRAQTMSSGTTVFDPVTGNPIVQIGGRGSSTGAPNSVVAKATERITKDIKMIEELASVERTLRPEDIGVRGVIGEEVLDRLLPQLGVSSADAQRADNRTKLKMAIEGAMKQVSDDTRFSNADRAAIKAVLPRAGMVESYENAMKTSQVLRRIIAKRALIDAKEIGRAAPQEAVRSLDPEGIRDAYRSGLISESEAINALAR